MNGKGPLVSVIVPVYNVAPYIDEALESLANQSYEHLEILLVDDGSTDGSGAACDRFAARDGRFVVIRQENRGLSAARNAGLEAMTGDVVGFLDPDDAFHPEMVERLLGGMARTGADLAVCGVAPLGGRRRRRGGDGERLLTREEALRARADGKLGVVVWSKLYDRALWRGLRFPEGRVFEDVATAFDVLDGIRACWVTDEALVYHRRRPGSITQSLTAKSIEDGRLAREHSAAYVMAHTPEVFTPEQAARVSQYELRGLLGGYGRLLGMGADGALLERWRQRIVEAGRSVSVADCPLSVRAAYAMAMRRPGLYRLAYPVYRAAKQARLRALGR